MISHSSRQVIAAAWIKAGLDEHASIASFSRFILHLLSLGAPPELLRDAARAMADEVEHAALCFGIAKQFTGKSVGPSALDISGAIDKILDVKQIIEAAIIEGCLGETFSACSAVRAQECSSDPALKVILGRIAEDEQRHAELSWRFIEWVQREYPEFSSHIDEVFKVRIADILAMPEVTVISDDEKLLERFGHLSACSRLQVIHASLRQYILPRLELIRHALAA